MDGAGEAEFERGRSDKSQFGVHPALSAPLESLSGMMRPNPIIIRTPQRSNSHQIRPGTNPQRQQLIRERQMSQRLSAEQRKEEELQAMRTRDAMRTGTQADRLPPISQAGTGSHRLAYADASVQRERQLLETRMQLGMPAESGLSRAYQVMGDGQSPVDFKVAADSARRLQSEMHLSMAEASTLRKLQQLQHQQNQLQRQVTPRLASQPRSRSASGRLNGDSLSSVSLPPIGNGVMTQGQPAPRATQEQHRQTEDIGMKVQSWHDLSRLSNFADQKHTKEATGSDQQIPVKHRTSDESQEEDQTIESSETSQARQHPTPQKLKRTIDASKVLEQPERYHTYERKAPNPTQEVLAPKETFNNRADEAEFRRLTKARLAKLSKHDREAMRRAAKARQALREAAEREKQKQMENKRAKMPPKPMDTQKLKIQENALRNHERRVADHQSVCAKVAEKANKSEEQLLMRIAGEEVERSQMAKAMTVGMPMYDDRRRYLRGVEFFHQRHQLGTDVGGIHMSPTKKERCIIPEPELVGKPLNIPGNTDASRRQSRWAAAPYTSLMWTDMEKLLWEVNAILDHKPEFDRLATRGRSMKRPVTSGADSKWAISRGDTAAVSAPRGPLEPARSGGWRPKSSPVAAVTDKHRVPCVTGDDRSLAQMTGNADNDQLLKAVNDRRRKEGKKAIARLPTQWKKMSSFDEGTAKAHVYARKDTQNRTSLQLAMEDPAKVRAGVAQISDIRRWHPYTPWFGGRPVSENNPAPFVEKANEDPEGLMPRLGCARPKLDRSRKRSHASHQQDGGAPPMSGVSQDDTLDTTISAYAASDQRLPGRTTRNMLLEAIIKDSTKRFAVDLGKSPDTGNNAGLEAVDSLSVQDGTDARRGDIAAGDGHKGTNASPSEVFQQLSRGLKSESARALRLKDASQKLLQYQQDLDHQAGQTKADVVDGEQKPAKGPSKEKEQAYYALVGNKIVFTKTMTKAKQSKDTAAAKRSYWHPDVASEVPKILIGEHEFAYCGEPEDAVEASSQASEKKVVVYGEAMVGEVILLPLPFHNNSNTRVDFELLELEENNSLGTHYAQNQDIYIIFCQQCQRTTVQGDLGDILFGFCAGRPGLFRQTFHMHFTPRLEGGRHVVVEVYGHALEPQASALAKLALPQLPSETMPLASATASGRAPEYKLIRRARHQFEREDELDRQALQMAGVPYQLSEASRNTMLMLGMHADFGDRLRTRRKKSRAPQSSQLRRRNVLGRLQEIARENLERCRPIMPPEPDLKKPRISLMERKKAQLGVACVTPAVSSASSAANTPEAKVEQNITFPVVEQYRPPKNILHNIIDLQDKLGGHTMETFAPAVTSLSQRRASGIQRPRLNALGEPDPNFKMPLGSRKSLPHLHVDTPSLMQQQQQLQAGKEVQTGRGKSRLGRTTSLEDVKQPAVVAGPQSHLFAPTDEVFTLQGDNLKGLLQYLKKECEWNRTPGYHRLDIRVPSPDSANNSPTKLGKRQLRRPGKGSRQTSPDTSHTYADAVDTYRMQQYRVIQGEHIKSRRRQQTYRQHGPDRVDDPANRASLRKDDVPFQILAKTKVARQIFGDSQGNDDIALQSGDEIQRAGDLDFITDIVDDLVACVVDRPESQPLVRRQEEEDILFEVNPSLQLVHMNLVPTLETMHALATNAPEDEEALAEAGLATPKPAEGKAGVKSAKTGKGKDKDKDKKGGKGAKAAEPPPADKPVELQMDINPNAVWDYRIPTLHELILKPVQPSQEDKRKRCAELYEKVSVSTNDPHLENDSGTIREDLLDVHQRTTSFMRLLLEGLVDTVADTCTSLRHQMNLPLGDMGDDAAQAKDMTSPEKGAGPDKGKGKGGQKKPEPKRKESKLAKDTKDAKKKDAGKGKGKTDAVGKQDGVQSDGAKDAANEDKTLVDPEKLAWFRDLAYLQVRDKISEMLDGVSAVEAEIEPELKLPDFAPMLDAELGVIAEPIDVGDVFGSIHDEVCYINPLKPKSSSEMFKKLLNAAKLDRVDIVKGKVQAYDKAKIDPSKEVRFEP
eukprot:scpid5653/ scgid4043/ 